MNDSNWSYQQKNDIKEKTVHPSFIDFHGMESATERYPDSELDVSFLHWPQQIETQISENESCYEASVSLLKAYQELIEKWYEGPWVTSISFNNVSKNSVLKNKTTFE